mmetsp:Transcript_12720/g.37884  ORF Transcript_12720/g.37884 Transcript_12720/m.37884 type:complete len:328 (+) Transcript_12720:106-1089(+)
MTTTSAHPPSNTYVGILDLFWSTAWSLLTQKATRAEMKAFTHSKWLIVIIALIRRSSKGGDKNLAAKGTNEMTKLKQPWRIKYCPVKMSTKGKVRPANKLAYALVNAPEAFGFKQPMSKPLAARMKNTVTSKSATPVLLQKTTSSGMSKDRSTSITENSNVTAIFSTDVLFQGIDGLNANRSFCEQVTIMVNTDRPSSVSFAYRIWVCLYADLPSQPHIMAVESSLPVQMISLLPSFAVWAVMPQMGASWPAKVCLHFQPSAPLRTQMRHVLSCPPVAMKDPSSENAASITAFVWPVKIYWRYHSSRLPSYAKTWHLQSSAAVTANW